MPLYEYRCADCDTTFEKFVRSMTAEVDFVCPKCHSGSVTKAFSTFATSGTDRRSTAAANCAPAATGGG
jgi:putative FmdB family regulatory protein